MRRIYTLIMVFMMLLASSLMAVTADSTTWEGSYEATDIPSNDGWTAVANAEYISIAQDGVLNMDSYDDDDYGYWTMSDVGFNFNTGMSIEFRAKMNEYQDGGSAVVQFYDVNASLVGITLRNNRISLTNSTTEYLDPNDFHTYRFTLNPDSQAVLCWLDDANEPFMSGRIAYKNMTTSDTLMFGDLTGTADADWDIDYIRWTNEGDFPPVGVTSYCGDSNNLIPVGDLDFNCIVDIGDFAVMANMWLMDTRPVEEE
ncbi:MAG: hypothetical protein ACIAQZ_01340 [Sedimentisphaeraceae bacterium JB056]